MNKDLMEALDLLEKEKQISRESLFEAIASIFFASSKEICKTESSTFSTTSFSA